MTNAESVSGAEIRRLREGDVALSALRDSLNSEPVRVGPEATAATFAPMWAQIYFPSRKSELTSPARRLLDEEIVGFRANPNVTIVLLGYAAQTGANTALGGRRAQAVMDYIVANGIAPSRVVIRSDGSRQRIPNSTGAPSGSAIFWVLIAPDMIK
jgi:peptidoglycan-associated lipoprotein